MPSTSLIILGKSLDPTAITRRLKLKPSRAWKKGERKSFQRRDGSVHFFDSKHKWGGWKLWSTEAQRQKDISRQIHRWVALLTRKKKALAQIRASGCAIFIDCCIVGEADSVSLSPAMLAKLAALGLTFEATFYSSFEEEPNKAPEPTPGIARSSQGSEVFNAVAGVAHL